MRNYRIFWLPGEISGHFIEHQAGAEWRQEHLYAAGESAHDGLCMQAMNALLYSLFWMELLLQQKGMSVNGENEHHLAASTSCMGCAARLSDRGPTTGTSERLVLPPLTPSGLSQPSNSCGRAIRPSSHPSCFR